MPTSHPLVSVIVPCFNQARYLPDALESLIAQTYPHWECIVVDDGSTDSTRAVSLEYARRDARVRYVWQPNRGLSGARNRGLDEIHGALVQFLDADDILAADKLQSQVSALPKDGSPSVAVGDYCFMDESGRQYRDGYCTPEFLMEKPLHDLALRWESDLSIPVHAFLFDRRLFEDDRVRFNEDLPNHEDWACWMTLFAKEPKVVAVREVGAIYRVRSDSMCRNRSSMWSGFRSAIALQRKAMRGDARVRRLLSWLRRITDDRYGRGLHAYLHSRLLYGGRRWKILPGSVRAHLLSFSAPRSAADYVPALRRSPSC